MSLEQHQQNDDELLDATLREFFVGTLDAQLGRAERAFQSHLRREASSGRRQRTLLILAFTGSMAATIAGLWASPLLRTLNPGKPAISQGGPVADDSFTPVSDVVEHLTKSRTIDEGIVLLDGEPMRVYRRQAVEQVNTLDQDAKLKSQDTTPSDSLVFVKMNTY